MNSLELARIIEKTLREEGGNLSLIRLSDYGSIVFDMDGTVCIPVMENADKGLRKRFTIKVIDNKIDGDT